MYTVALTPVLVGTSAAYAETGVISLWTAMQFLQCTVFIIAWLNLTNDVFDFDAGIDDNKPESVVNLMGSKRSARNMILFIANVFLVLAFATLAGLCYHNARFDATILIIIGAAVLGGYMYQGPPFRLGYLGLGEPICYVTWTLGVAVAYYLQMRHFSSDADKLHDMRVMERVAFLFNSWFLSGSHYLWTASTLVALPTTIILFCSHFHQYEEDKRACKLSPIVRLGTKRASQVLDMLLGICFVLPFLCLLLGMIAVVPAIATLSAVPTARRLSRFVRKNHDAPHIVRIAKYIAVKMHFIHGIALTLGYALHAQRLSRA